MAGTGRERRGVWLEGLQERLGDPEGMDNAAGGGDEGPGWTSDGESADGVMDREPGKRRDDRMRNWPKAPAMAVAASPLEPLVHPQHVPSLRPSAYQLVGPCLCGWLPMWRGGSVAWSVFGSIALSRC